MSDDFDPYRCRGVTPPGGPTMEELTAATWKERALRAEQRAEAAEAERDRMRERERALSFPLKMWAGWARETYANNHRSLSGPDHALLTAIDAYRAGQPATSEAERIAAAIAAWLDRSAPSIAARFRAGEWRKS